MTSNSGSLASDLFLPQIWGDLVKISRGEHTENREGTNNSFFLNLEQCIAKLQFQDNFSKQTLAAAPIIIQNNQQFKSLQTRPAEIKIFFNYYC